MTNTVANNSDLARTKIQNALARCMRKDVGMSSILLRLPLVNDNGIETMCTDGKVIKYCDDFVLKHDGKEIEGVLLHEGYHVIFMHHLRMGKRNHKLWNVACDYAINGYIYYDLKLPLPENGCIDEAYRGMSAEKIYDILDNDDDALDKAKQQMQKAHTPGDDEGKSDDSSDEVGETNSTGKYSSSVMGTDAQSSASGDKYDDIPTSLGEIVTPTDDDGEPLSDSEIEELEQDIIRAMQMGDMVARMSGDGSVATKGRIDQIREAKINWVDVLTDHLTPIYSDESTWSRPNRRHQWSGTYMPSRDKNPNGGKIAIAVDTSVSVSQEELDYFASETQAMCEQLGIKQVMVCFCDTIVHKNDDDEWWDRFDLEHGETVEFNLRGGGGTHFDPVFNLLNKHTDDNDIDALIYFTDGYGKVSSKVEPDIPVFWGLTCKYLYRDETRERYRIPFGELIHVDVKRRW